MTTHWQSSCLRRSGERNRGQGKRQKEEGKRNGHGRVTSLLSPFTSSRPEGGGGKGEGIGTGELPFGRVLDLRCSAAFEAEKEVA